jgi:hypothetical protein
VSDAPTEIGLPASTLLEQQTEDPPPPPLENPRDAIMRGIAERREAQIRAADEDVYGVQEDAAPDADAGPVDEPIDAPRSSDPVEAAPAPIQAPQVQQPQLRTVMVQGHPLQVTEEQLLHLAQIGAVANAAMQQQQYQQQQQPPAPVYTPPPAEVLSNEDAAGFARRLQYGDENEGAAAVKELAERFGRQRGATVDAEEIRRAAVAETLQHLQVQNDLHTLGPEFPEIFESRLKSQTAIAALTQIRERDAMYGQRRMPLEQYREACSMVRAEYGAPQPQSAVQGSSASQAALSGDRLERKRVAPRNPVGASRKAPMPAAESAVTGASIVDRMKIARGQLPAR